MEDILRRNQKNQIKATRRKLRKEYIAKKGAK